jgi:hypothetical protein
MPVGLIFDSGFVDMPIMAVHSEDRDQDAQRYQLLSAYLLLTGLMRRVRMTVSPSASNAERYRALKDNVLSNGIMRHMELPTGETMPFVVGKELYGETVEEAVDSLEAWSDLHFTATQGWYGARME